MHKKNKSYFLVVALLSLVGFRIGAAVVTSLLDDGGAGTLRSVIASAPGGDTITFSGSGGTILLDEALGNLIIDKQLTIDGQNKIIVDGGNGLNIGFHIINTGTADASGSTIQNITIQNFNGHDAHPGSGTASQELDAFGVLIEGGIVDCSVINTAISNIHAGIGTAQEAAGIKAGGVLDAASNNTIFDITSEDNGAGDSGRVAGMLLFAGVDNNFSNNTVYNVSSGSASADSGEVYGVFIDNQVDTDISNNSIYNLSSGSAGVNSGFVYGIFVDDVTVDHNVSNNTIYNLSSGSGGSFSATIFGLLFNGVINGNIDGNTIHHCTAGASPSASGWVQGVQFSTVVNGDVINNTIHHLVGDSTGPFSGYVSGLECYSSMNGIISNNTIYELRNTPSTDDTYFVVGMTFYSPVTNEVSNNTIHTLSSGAAGTDSGPVYGISCSVTVDASFEGNTLHDLASGDASATAGDVTGLIFFDGLNGDLLQNNLHNLVSGAADNSFSVHAFFVHGNFDGTCSYNAVEHLAMGTAPNSVESMGGIKLSSVTSGSVIECNSVVDITGNGDTVFGIEVTEGDNLIVRRNTINEVDSTNAAAHGILLGSSTTFVTNSLVFCNTTANISGNNNSGYGVTVTGSGSVGNDILNNSIFSINGKAINIETLIDANVMLDSLGCFDGCKIRVTLSIDSLIGTDMGTEKDEFLVQFFVSDSNIPSQAQTFIGERVVKSGTSTVRFVPVAPVTFGQYITATATALTEGSDMQNNNTSEVSNALAACEPVVTFCPVFPNVSSSKPCQVLIPDETCAPCTAP